MEPQDLWKIFLLDKIGMAVLLAVAGYLFNRTLEVSKAKLAFKSELAKQRVGPIAKTWVAFSQAEAEGMELLQKVGEVILKYGDDIKARKAALMKLFSQERFTKRAEALKEVLIENRFWLGETEYKKFQEYGKLLLALQEAFADGELERFKAIEKKLDAVRQSIESYESLM